ncbi:MAG TPA: malto-oligosyltrehalose trehalohydrolase [Thermoanaerobaculia bacterium]
MAVSRRRPVGAEVVRGGVHFRVWAPAAARVSVVIDPARDHELEREGDGYFSALVRDARGGDRYRYRLDGGEAYPDPASRFQPDGPHGPSEVIDPSFEWSDATWRGPQLHGAVISEVHIGTFTKEGTFAAAIARLDALADAGINVVELMPVSEFPGRFGWGYDGVDLYAPTRLYGRPDDLRRFVDAAHSRGIAVLLDVVYNHLGPDGCYLSKFSHHYFTKKYENDWGEAINFDGEASHGAREFFVQNAAYWIDEFHIDGLRLDATQSMYDASRTHIIREICETARRAAGDRSVLIIGEDEPQDVDMIRQHGLDALWNDDWHHSSVVALTGRREAYYTDYAGAPQEFVSMTRHGYLYQGQYYRWQKKRRGTPSIGIPARHFITYLENHDQLANSVRGERLHATVSAGALRAMTAYLLLGPQTPMLFQGQEFAASSPFLYFADHEPELAKKVAEGRSDFLQQFASIASAKEALAAPHDPQTFERSKIDWSDRDRNAHVLAMHRDLIRLRRTDPLFRTQRADLISGSVLGEHAFALRWVAGTDDRLLIVNLGSELLLHSPNDPLLAPAPHAEGWEVLWSSEAPEYGGSGTADVEREDGWTIPAQAAVVLKAR